MTNEMIVYTYKADTRGYQNSVDGAESSNKSFISSTTVMITAVAGAVVGMGSMVGMASNLDEAMNVVQVSLGSSSDAVIKWSEDSIQSMGISQTEALKTAGVYANMATSLGFSQEEAAKMSMEMTQLTADLASFNNVSQEQAAIALKGVFTGETEALKEYGIMIDVATLKQYGYNENMTQAEKVQIRYKAVLDQTTNAQGDFVRTSDGMANQTRILKEQIKQLGTEIGAVLLPYFLSLVHVLNDLVAIAIALVSGETENLTESQLALISYLQPLVNIFNMLATVLNVIWSSLTLLTQQVITSISSFFELSSVTSSVTLFIANLSHSIIQLVTNMTFLIQEIISTVTSMFEIISQTGILTTMFEALSISITIVRMAITFIIETVLQAVNSFLQLTIQSGVLNSIINLLNNTFAILQPTIIMIATLFISLYNAIQPVIVALAQLLMPVLNILINTLTILINVVMTVVNTILTFLVPTISFLANILSVILVVAIDLVTSALSILQVIVNVISLVFQALANVINSILVVAFGLLQSIVTVVNKVFQGFSDVANKLTNIVITLANSLKNTLAKAFDIVLQPIELVQDALESLFNIMNSVIDSIEGFFNAVGNGLNKIPGINKIVPGNATFTTNQQSATPNTQSQSNVVNNFNIQANEVMNFRQAYRSARAVQLSGGYTL